MALERLFELIRKEDVVILSGAGTSLYAGFPSGQQLTEIIYNRMTVSEKASISPHLQLLDLTEELIRLRMSRNSIIDILKETFLKTPISLHLHKTLSDIPHFKTIITTNYDQLFELAYQNDCTVVKMSSDLPYLKKDLPEIFKVHGDLSFPDSIIISKTDYTKFFDSQKEEVLWNVVKERTSTHHVLFIGYNLEDINMESIFRKLREHLGPNRKEAFLIAPGLPLSKTQQLINDGIHYIDSTFEEFVNSLYLNIKENIYEDFQNKSVSPDTFRIFLKRNNLAPKLHVENDQFKVMGVDGTGQPVEGRIVFDVLTENESFIEKLNSITSSKEVGEIILDESSVNNLSLFLNGIRIKNDSEKLILKSAPVYTTVCNIVFSEGNEYDNQTIEIFRTQTKIIFSVTFPCIEFHLEVLISDILNSNLNHKVNFKHLEHFGLINEEIKFYEFLRDFATASELIITPTGIDSISFHTQTCIPLLEHAEKYLHYFDLLKKVEKHYKFKFSELKEITQETYNRLRMIVDDIDNVPFGGISTSPFVLEYTNELKLTNIIDQFVTATSLSSEGTEPETINLHGKEIYMGYRKTKMLQPYIENIDDLNTGVSKYIIVKSRIDTIEITFTK